LPSFRELAPVTNQGRTLLRPQDRNRRLLDELARAADKDPAQAEVKPSVPAGPGRAPVSGSRRLAADLFAGLVVGVVTLTFSISCAALVFSGPLARDLPLGIASAIVSASVTALVVAWRSSLPLAIAGPDSHGSAVLAIMAAGIASSLSDPDQAAATVLAVLVLSTVVTGVFLYALGRLRVGHYVRFIPVPVVGGFLAGAGLLIVRGSFVVMADVPLGFHGLPDLIQAAAAARWLPGASLALLLYAAQRKTRHFLVLPGILVGAVGLFHLAWCIVGDRAAPPAPADWFLAPFSSEQLRQAFSSDLLAHVDAAALLRQGPDLLTLLVVVVIAVLLNATGVEIATQQDCDFNRELRANGLANMLAGLCGGMLGYLSLTRSLLNARAHAASRFAGAFAGLLCGLVLVGGGPFIAVFPRAVVGGLLLYLGLSLLVEWVYTSWFKFSRADYLLVLLILAIIAIWGFLVGVAAGVVIASLVFAYNYSQQRVIKHAFTGASHQSHVDRPVPQQRFLWEHGDQVYILTLQGYIFFGTASSLLDHVRQRLEAPDKTRPRFLVFDFRTVTGLDSSAALGFVKIRQLAARHGVCRVFTGLRPHVEQQLRLGGCLDAEGSSCQVFPDLDRGVEWCENQLLEAGWSRRRKSVPLVLQLTELFPAPDQAAAFMTYLERLHVPAGHTLFDQREEPDAMYFIESGQVTVLLRLEPQWSMRLRTVSAGTTLGEQSFFTGRPHQTSAVAEVPSVLYRLSHAAMQRLRHDAPQTAMTFQEFIIRSLAERLAYAYEEIEVFLADARLT
jgi:SulP family sulfate permease